MSKKKILWINPLASTIFNKPMYEYLCKIKEEDTTLDVVSLEKGPKHLEYRWYQSLVLLDTLKRIKQAEKEGYDATVIGVFYDSGLIEAREIVEKMCITGPAESTMHIASTLGNKFSIITGRDKWIPQMMENVVNKGFKDKLASFKSVGLGVYEVRKDKELTEKLLKEAAKEAVEKDKAEVIILGGTVSFGFYKVLQDYLGVPVIDPIIAALKYAEFLAELKQRISWTPSKIGAYETPPISEIKEWKLESQYEMEGLWD